MRPKILVFSQIDKLHQSLFEFWFKIAQNAIQKQGWFAAAISGGKTPESFYRQLSRQKRNPLWQHTHLFIADERFVSRSHQENNGKMIQESLLNHIEIPEKNIHFVDTH